MQNTRNITPEIYWVGGGDRRLSRFENIFPLENGVTYNAHLIMDEKTALLDTVDASVSRQFIENLTHVLGGRPLDYLVINHMEPDHCADIVEIRRLYPAVTIVGNAKTFQLMQQFYSMDVSTGTLQVKEGDTLPLGKHTLQFFMAPMVHWPEVMFTYESSEKILFSADAFGTFGGYDGSLFSDEMDFEGQLMDEARRYYANIVGKYGAQVQAVLKKLAGTTIEMICPLHGPVLRGDDLALMMEKYQAWSTYAPETQGVLIAYASMYGHTENAVHLLADALKRRGVKALAIYDVSNTHFSTIISETFRLSHLVLASPTYNLGLFSPMETLVRDMAALNVQNRQAAIIGNGSWAPAAHTIMQKMLGEMKNMTLLAEPMLVRSAVTPEQVSEIEALADTIAASVAGE